jgi:hypothetical protein
VRGVLDVIEVKTVDGEVHHFPDDGGWRIERECVGGPVLVLHRYYHHIDREQRVETWATPWIRVKTLHAERPLPASKTEGT